MDATTWSKLLGELTGSVGELQRFFEAERAVPLTPRDAKSLERLFDRYLTADEALAHYVDALLHRSTRRPRR